MSPKRAAKSSGPPPPPADSSEETDSRSRSEESEEEETHAVTSTPASKNTPAPPQQKGEQSESSDEEEEEEDDDEEEESDEEPTHAAPTTAPKNTPPPPRQSEESDSSDEEEEEELDSESDEEAPPAKPAPKQEAVDQKPPSSGQAKKPAAPFHRVWSTDDEVRILEALAAHRREHGALPQPDALVAALAGRLDNRAYGGKELQGKVKSLKNRYVTAAKKSELPSKEHDRRLFDLSKIVWGGDKTGAPAAVAKAKAEGKGHEPRGFGEMCDLYPYLAEEVKELEAAHPGMFKREFGKMGDDKALVLDLKIKKQRLVQMKVELRRSDLTKEVTKTLMDLVE